MSKKNRNKQNQQVAVSTEVEQPMESVIENEEVLEPEVEEVDIVPQEIAEEIEEAEIVEPEKEAVLEDEEQEKPLKEDEEQPPVAEVKKEIKASQPIYREGVINVEPKSASQVAAAKAVVSPAVEKFNELSTSYIENMTKGPIDEDIKRRGIAILANIARHVTMSTEVPVFEACFKFFVKQRAIMLNSTTVIDGINKYLDKGKIAKVVQFYVTFQTLAESKILGAKFTLNVTTIRRLFNNDALANWLLARRSAR